VLPAVTSPSAVWVLVLGVAALAFAASLRRRRARRRQWEDEEARQWEDDGGDPHADAPDEPSNVR
jgi:hypothetical protein